MIQRIQSVYLVFTIVLLVCMLFLPIAELVSEVSGMVYSLGLKGILNEQEVASGFSVLPYSILLILSVIIAVITLFLYKKRMLQIRLTIVNLVLLLGLQGLTFYYINAAAKILNANYAYKLVFIFPLVGFILSLLAFRAISRDEALVRSLDRLR